MLTVWLGRPRIAYFVDLARRLEMAARVVQKALGKGSASGIAADRRTAGQRCAGARRGALTALFSCVRNAMSDQKSCQVADEVCPLCRVGARFLAPSFLRAA